MSEGPHLSRTRGRQGQSTGAAFVEQLDGRATSPQLQRPLKLVAHVTFQEAVKSPPTTTKSVSLEMLVEGFPPTSTRACWASCRLIESSPPVKTTFLPKNG